MPKIEILEVDDNDLTILQELFYHYREEYRLGGDQLDLFHRILRLRGASEEFIAEIHG